MNRATLVWSKPPVMRALLALATLVAVTALAKPSASCVKTCEEGATMMAAACKQQSKSKDHSEEAKACKDGVQTMRTQCALQCSKYEAAQNRKR